MVNVIAEWNAEKRVEEVHDIIDNTEGTIGGDNLDRVVVFFTYSQAVIDKYLSDIIRGEVINDKYNDEMWAFVSGDGYPRLSSRSRLDLMYNHLGLIEKETYKKATKVLNYRNNLAHQAPYHPIDSEEDDLSDIVDDAHDVLKRLYSIIQDRVID